MRTKHFSAATMDTCLVCFSPIQGLPIRCGAPRCTAAMCAECTGFLLDYSFREEMMPRCPSNHCKSIILFKNIRNFPQIHKYHDVCLKELLKTKGDIAQKKVNAEVMLGKLRQERQTFIRDHFPAAVAMVASLAFNSKVTRLEKQKRDKITETLASTHRKCMNLMCTGLLDADYKCIKCSTQFCRDCEKRCEPGHKCDERDRQSIAFIQNMVKCPKCGLAIERSDGCSAMRCANCGTNFDYNTGKAGGGGNEHNAAISAQERIMLSIAYESELSPTQLSLLIDIEGAEPRARDDQAVTNLLKKHYRGEQVDPRDVTATLHRWIEQSYRVKNYYRYIGEIEKLIRDGQLEDHHLHRILKEIL